jgi:hypothetical protein
MVPEEDMARRRSAVPSIGLRQPEATSDGSQALLMSVHQSADIELQQIAPEAASMCP